MRRIIHKLMIAEISVVDKPSQKPALMTIMKRDNGDDDIMSQKFTKVEANAEWDRALEAYAARNKLTKSAVAAEFSTTIEAKNIYNKILCAEHGLPIAKAAPRPLTKAQQAVAALDVTFEVMAKEAFKGDPTPIAVSKFLKTKEGSDLYTEYLQGKVDVDVR